jgi:hypothetical protein
MSNINSRHSQTLNTPIMTTSEQEQQEQQEPREEESPYHLLMLSTDKEEKKWSMMATYTDFSKVDPDDRLDYYGNMCACEPPTNVIDQLLPTMMMTTATRTKKLNHKNNINKHSIAVLGRANTHVFWLEPLQGVLADSCCCIEVDVASILKFKEEKLQLAQTKKRHSGCRTLMPSKSRNSGVFQRIRPAICGLRRSAGRSNPVSFPQGNQT